MINKDLENAWAVQGIRQEKCARLEEENKKLRKDLAETQKIGESRRQECKQLRKQYQHSMGFSDFGGYKDKNE